MNPGLPGLGIGGLFYIVSALAMPLVALLRALRGRPAWPARTALAARQCAIAVGIVGNQAIAFWALDAAVVMLMLEASVAGGLAQDQWHVMRVSALVLTAGVLTMVLGAMHLARLLTGGQRTPVRNFSRWRR